MRYEKKSSISITTSETSYYTSTVNYIKKHLV